MNEIEARLRDAQNKAENLFHIAEKRGYIIPDQTENDLNIKMYDLAFELFGIKKYWHKRIVRAGKNTLFPYRENPPNLLIEKDDILFFDFGPVFEDWEADLGRTYVLGNDPYKIKLRDDIIEGWHKGKDFFDKNKDITGSEFYNFSVELAKSYGWEYGGPMCGHLIGNFPHEKIQGDKVLNYIHPDNPTKMRDPDKNNEPRHWIYEIHFVDKEKQIGGFFEQLLTVD